MVSIENACVGNIVLGNDLCKYLVSPITFQNFDT